MNLESLRPHAQVMAPGKGEHKGRPYVLVTVLDVEEERQYIVSRFLDEMESEDVSKEGPYANL